MKKTAGFVVIIFDRICLCALTAVGNASAASQLFSDADFADGRTGSLCWAANQG